MQDELIFALRTLQPVVDQKRMQRVLNAIEAVVIPPDDYEEVIHFISLLLEEMPEVAQAKPYDEPLKKLCLLCCIQLGYSPLFKPLL